MARYDTYIRGDDRVQEELDFGFIGFNNRLRPDQLKPGILGDSQNGRLSENTEWQTRKGIDNIKAPLSTGTAALTLPFFLINDASGYTSNTLVAASIFKFDATSYSRSGETLTINFNSHTLIDGDTISISGLTVGGGVNPNGTRTVTNASTNSFDVVVTGMTDTPTGTLAVDTQRLYVVIPQDLTSTLTLGMSGVVFIDATNIGGVSLTTANHSVRITAIDSSSATFRINDVTYTSGTPSGTVDLDSSKLDDNVVNEIYGSCIFSDPNSESDSYIILAANSKAIAINVANPSTSYDLNYPSGETVSSSVDMIQAFNKLFIFRKGATPFEKDLASTNINTSPTLDKVTSGEYSQPTQIVCASGEFALIENRGVVHQSDGVSEGDIISVVGDKTLSGDQSSGLTIGERFTVAKVFTGGSTTSITAATKLSITGGEFDGLYKVTLTAAGHGKNVGDPIDVAGFGDTKIDGSRFVAEVNGNDVVVYVPQNPTLTISGDETLALAHGFEFYLDSKKTDSHTTDGDSLTSTPVFAKKVSEGLGFSHMPAPEYGVYHQKRLAVPYRYNVSDAADTYTDRKIFDEILLSDILDTDTYDQVYGQFRFNAGASDFNVGMHSFSDDKLIVFNRNSIHLVQNSLDLASASVQLLTDEVGLIARDSVIQVGNQVLFLSDNGIYGMSFVDLYNLRGNEVPLSESIDPTIKTIDKANASKASAVYFDNRYYIAVPTGTDGFNNKILIYNFLTKQWESIDSVGTTDIDGASVQAFEFTKLLVAGEGDKRGVYVVNTDGGIHKLEVYEDGIDRIITEIGETTKKNVRVSGSATTRMFTLRSIDRKKWNNFEMHLQSSPNFASNVNISATTENLDSEPAIDLKTADFYLGNDITSGEDVSIRGRIGNKRAYGLQMTIDSTLGRPRLRSVKVAGAETFRSTSSVE